MLGHFETGVDVHRSSHHWCSVKRGVLKNFAVFTGNTCFGESLFKKVAGLKAFIKNRYQRKCYPVNITKFLRTFISKNIICGRLLLCSIN